MTSWHLWFTLHTGVTCGLPTNAAPKDYFDPFFLLLVLLLDLITEQANNYAKKQITLKAR